MDLVFWRQRIALFVVLVYMRIRVEGVQCIQFGKQSVHAVGFLPFGLSSGSCSTLIRFIRCGGRGLCSG